MKPTSAHNALTTIVENGKQLEIVRDNMPFGDVGKGEFGTYFIGYARSPHRIEQMLVNMFVGRPPGNYDRLLDYQPRRDRHAVFRAVSDVPGGCCDRRSGPIGRGSDPRTSTRSMARPNRKYRRPMARSVLVH